MDTRKVQYAKHKYTCKPLVTFITSKCNPKYEPVFVCVRILAYHGNDKQEVKLSQLYTD
jgi:hypothetical protein